VWVPPGQELSSEALAWVVGYVGPGGRVVAVRRLTGGISSAVHRITVVTRLGQRHHVVCRRWLRDVSQGDNGADNVRQEAAILQALEPVAFAPRLIAIDPDGFDVGAPALLMTCLPGRLELTPEHPERWTSKLASTLAEIHHLDVSAPPYDPWLNLDELRVPPGWARQPQLWNDAVRLYRAGPPDTATGFVHHDYQQFNVLWSRGRISGVVDWGSASRGPQDADVAHCRLNLTVLYSPARAESFRRYYEAEAGRRVHPWWDMTGLLAYLPGWGASLQRQAGRRLRIDFAGMHDRVEDALQSILDRM
jgi:aminoglycoside phosphotransferase (APT) family kinase protein